MAQIAKPPMSSILLFATYSFCKSGKLSAISTVVVEPNLPARGRSRQHQKLPVTLNAPWSDVSMGTKGIYIKDKQELNIPKLGADKREMMSFRRMPGSSDEFQWLYFENAKKQTMLKYRSNALITLQLDC